MGTEANGVFVERLCSIQRAHALPFWKLHTAASTPAPRWQVGRARWETLSQFLKSTELVSAQSQTLNLPLPKPSPYPPGNAPVGFLEWGGEVGGVGRPFWEKQGPDAQGGLGRCQAQSRGRGMGVAGRRLTCFPTEGFGICPRQELRARN